MIIEIPMPMTSNHMYTPVNGRLIKSNEARNYDKHIDLLKLKLCRKLDEYKKQLNPNSLIKIDRIFVFSEKRFFTKKKELRKIDTSNRIKLCDDSISKLIEVDDSQFISGNLIKTYHSKEQEIVYIKLTVLDEALDFDQILTSLKD